MSANKTMLSSVSWTNLWLDDVWDNKSRSMVGNTENRALKALHRVVNVELYFTEKQQSSAIYLS